MNENYRKIDLGTFLSKSRDFVMEYIGKDPVIRKQLAPLAKQVWDDIDCALDCYYSTNQPEQKRSRVLELTLKSIVFSQADLLWRYKGTPENQAKELQINDYHNARRYVGYVIAHRIFESCFLSKCLFVSLPQPCIEYLQILSLDEFVRYKAYHLYRERIESGENVKGDEYSDYYNAIGFLDQVMIRTPQCSQHDLQCVSKIFKLAKHIDNLPLIENAKKNTLIRLGRMHLYDSVKGFIDNLYGIVQMIERGDKIPQRLVNKAVRDLYAITSVANVLEFALKCYLLQLLPANTHNNIRNDNGKMSV